MNSKDGQMDALLKRSLGSSERPAPELIRKVKYEMIMEESVLKKATVKRSLSAAAAAVIACVLIPASVFAAWHFLSPSQIAEEFEHAALAEAFESDGALVINEMQSDNGYDITLLGIVSGDGLTELDNAVDSSKTYAAVAIAKQDGDMPDTADADYGSTPFFVSPLIHGQKPWQFNIASMNGGYAAFVRDGIMYQLVECDSIEMFADRGLSLIVSSTSFYSIEAYGYDEKTGVVTPIPSFDGVNLVFDLPLDTSNADYEKAQQYLDSLWEENTERAEQSPINEGEIGSEIIITNEGSILKEVMTQESMSAWIEKKLEEGRAKVERGEYSESSLALDKSDYEEYLKAVEDGQTVIIHTYEDGSYAVTVSDPNSEFPVDISDDGLNISFGDPE